MTLAYGAFSDLPFVVLFGPGATRAVLVRHTGDGVEGYSPGRLRGSIVYYVG